jgi:hypothetical protein
VSLSGRQQRRGLPRRRNFCTRGCKNGEPETGLDCRTSESAQAGRCTHGGQREAARERAVANCTKKRQTVSYSQSIGCSGTMTKMAAQFQRVTFVALISGLCLGLPALSQAGVATSPPPSGQEPAAVTREIAEPAETAADSQAQPDSQSCNATLVASIIKQKLDIDFGGGELNGGRGDLIELVCKAHPSRPGQTIVALFHELKDKRGDYEADKKGFAVAVIDAKRRLLHGLHLGTVEEEATIRVGPGTLSIDTARYNLAPGVRAFGVRMNIGYSPRCAEGGENDYLTLFVEEGKQLRPVLSAFPMSSWQAREGSQVCGDSETGAEIESTSLTLALSASSSGGWRDLDVVARTTQDMGTQDGSAAAVSVGKPRVIARLRKTAKGYQRQ